MNRLLRFVAACVLAGVTAPALAAQRAPVLILEPFSLRTYDGQQQAIEIGRITVPESRDKPAGASVSVAFYRLKSTASAPGSPIVFLMGGPGIAASVIAPIPPYWTLFDKLRAVGDVILLDQRGLGLSKPALDCPPPAEPPDPAFLTSRAAFSAAYGKILSFCAAHYRAQGMDPLAYSDAAIADDIDDIRAALGAERVSLLGFSYGSRLAMTYVRRHPDRLDRLVLQGPTDEQMLYRSSLAHDSLFERLARRAATDSVSAAFSQGLVARTRTLFEKLNREALTVRIGSVRRESLTVPVGREALQGIISGRIAEPRIPALIETLEHGDLSILKIWVESMYNDFATGAGSLMSRAVTCSQRPTADRVARVDAEGARSMFGPSFDNFVVTNGFCGSLGTRGLPSVAHLAKPLDRPVLFVVGDLDDRTPASNVASLGREFARSTLVVVENGGHELLPDARVHDSVVDFLFGKDVSGRRLRVDSPRYLSVEDAKRPSRRPGQ